MALSDLIDIEIEVFARNRWAAKSADDLRVFSMAYRIVYTDIFPQPYCAILIVLPIWFSSLWDGGLLCLA